MSLANCLVRLCNSPVNWTMLSFQHLVPMFQQVPSGLRRAFHKKVLRQVSLASQQPTHSLPLLLSLSVSTPLSPPPNCHRRSISSLPRHHTVQDTVGRPSAAATDIFDTFWPRRGRHDGSDGFIPYRMGSLTTRWSSTYGWWKETNSFYVHEDLQWNYLVGVDG